ncbi:Cu2+-exporting ATPase [Lishizhenia tianjinensis]|uniref:Cu2+-exporting ATPase n=1 Tax=Lishizhenia tianjinensis TaxID=477690 RepID=A0A1I6Y4S0_9FLAO|nr:heavy metal translocating P-type ATPase [Lishizhenia tianjinensis]SFT45466.1 Cu2+-exporting ATPase [Lishizhenia tianjinensis]
MSKTIKNTFPVEGMSCASCANHVEKALNNQEGVIHAAVNFADNSVTIECEADVNKESLRDAVSEAGYTLLIEDEDEEERKGEAYQKKLKNTIWAGVFTLPVFALSMFFMDWKPGEYISFVLSIPVLFVFGKHFFVNAFKQAKHGQVNMDSLVAMSTGIAFLISTFNTFYPQFWMEQGLMSHVYFEAATVIITFISIGDLLEERAKSKTSASLKKLIGLQPKEVQVERWGEVQTISIDKVAVHDVVLVKPGDKIPVDGEIISGDSYVDESMITGEPVAEFKQKDDQVFTGSINQNGSFKMKAAKVGKDTFLAQVIERVKEAQGSKAPVQKLADKIASVFVPTVFGIALLTFGAWMLWGGEDKVFHATMNAIAVMVIACPCALGLATPTAIMVGMGKGAENNILIKNAESLELAHKVNAIIIDKTGTVTEGKPVVTDILWSKDAKTEVLNPILLEIEEKSEHPLAHAIVQRLKDEGIKSSDELKSFDTLKGKGVKAKDEEGVEYFIGSIALMKELAIPLPQHQLDEAENWQGEAKTLVAFANKAGVLALIGIRDEIKEGAKSVLDDLKASGIDIYMMSGDSQATTAVVAKELGLTHFKGGVLPQDKAALAKDLQTQGKTVAMIGDGINDTEALAQADVSIAMGQGSDVAIDVAQITLIGSDLKLLNKAFAISHLTVKGIRQNLFWAFIYNLIGIPIAAGVLYPINGFLLDPMLAGAAMAFSSISVVLNSLRIKGQKI